MCLFEGTPFVVVFKGNKEKTPIFCESTKKKTLLTWHLWEGTWKISFLLEGTLVSAMLVGVRVPIPFYKASSKEIGRLRQLALAPPVTIWLARARLVAKPSLGRDERMHFPRFCREPREPAFTNQRTMAQSYLLQR